LCDSDIVHAALVVVRCIVAIDRKTFGVAIHRGDVVVDGAELLERITDLELNCGNIRGLGRIRIRHRISTVDLASTCQLIKRDG